MTDEEKDLQEQAWKWYTTVVRTRKHNDSQEIIVFTRWHEDEDEESL